MKGIYFEGVTEPKNLLERIKDLFEPSGTYFSAVVFVESMSIHRIHGIDYLMSTECDESILDNIIVEEEQS